MSAPPEMNSQTFLSASSASRDWSTCAIFTVGPITILPLSAFLAGDHAIQGRFSRAVGADDADDRPGGHVERQIVDEKALAVAFAHAHELDHRIAETVCDRDEDLLRFVALLVLVGGKFLEAREPRLRFRLAALGVLPHPFQL